MIQGDGTLPTLLDVARVSFEQMVKTFKEPFD